MWRAVPGGAREPQADAIPQQQCIHVTLLLGSPQGKWSFSGMLMATPIQPHRYRPQGRLHVVQATQETDPGVRSGRKAYFGPDRLLQGPPSQYSVVDTASPRLHCRPQSHPMLPAHPWLPCSPPLGQDDAVQATWWTEPHGGVWASWGARSLRTENASRGRTGTCCTSR